MKEEGKSTRLISWASPDLGEEEKKALVECIDRRWIGGNGPMVREFERTLEQTLGVRHAISCSNGTVALMTVFLALSSKAKRAAIPSFTFAATVNAAKLAVEHTLVDCERDTFNVSVNDLSKKEWDIAVPVHVGGLPADMEEIVEIATKRGGYVVEDAAEAIGAMYHGRFTGTFGDIACFSFYATKIVTCEEGGCITTNRDDLADSCHQIIDHGYTRTQKTVGYQYLYHTMLLLG